MPNEEDEAGREETRPEQVEAFASTKRCHAPSLLRNGSVDGWVAVLLALLHAGGFVCKFHLDAGGVCSLAHRLQGLELANTSFVAHAGLQLPASDVNFGTAPIKAHHSFYHNTACSQEHNNYQTFGTLRPFPYKLQLPNRF
jgi:hypothetical protein